MQKLGLPLLSFQVPGFYPGAQVCCLCLLRGKDGSIGFQEYNP